MQQPEHLREKVTGARADRRELNRMLGKLAPGDVVTVTRIDRLARSTFDLFAIVKRIVDAKAQFRFLAEPWADSTSSTGRLMLAVLGGLADVERDLIRTRTAEGRSRAKARGTHMGRPPSSQHRHRRKRPSGGARRALYSKNWRTATTSAARRFRGSRRDNFQFNLMGLMTCKAARNAQKNTNTEPATPQPGKRAQRRRRELIAP